MCSKSVEASTVQYISVNEKLDINLLDISIEDIEYIHHDDTVVEIYGLKGTIYNSSMMAVNVSVSVDYYDANYNFLTSSTCKPVVGSSKIYKVFPVDLL